MQSPMHLPVRPQLCMQMSLFVLCLNDILPLQGGEVQELVKQETQPQVQVCEVIRVEVQASAYSTSL